MEICRASHHKDARSAKMTACVCQCPITGAELAMLFPAGSRAGPHWLSLHPSAACHVPCVCSSFASAICHYSFAIIHLSLSISICRSPILLLRGAIRGRCLRAQSMRNYSLASNLCEVALLHQRGLASPHQSPCLHVLMFRKRPVPDRH